MDRLGFSLGMRQGGSLGFCRRGGYLQKGRYMYIIMSILYTWFLGVPCCAVVHPLSEIVGAASLSPRT